VALSKETTLAFENARKEMMTSAEKMRKEMVGSAEKMKDSFRPTRSSKT